MVANVLILPWDDAERGLFHQRRESVNKAAYCWIVVVFYFNPPPPPT